MDELATAESEFVDLVSESGEHKPEKLMPEERRKLFSIIMVFLIIFVFLIAINLRLSTIANCIFIAGGFAIMIGGYIIGGGLASASGIGGQGFRYTYAEKTKIDIGIETRYKNPWTNWNLIYISLILGVLVIVAGLIGYVI
jgi:hypothetical protein